MAGRVDAARMERNRLESMAADRYAPAIFRGWVAFALGDTASAAALIEQAVLAGEPCVALTSSVVPPGLRALAESAIARHRRSGGPHATA